jgi:protein TonB
LDYHDSHQSISGKLVIPSKVRYNDVTYYVVGIGDEAFEKCTGLTSVTIPNSVKVIEEEAFQYCYSLSSITLPDGLRYLPSNAFDNTLYYNNEANWENGVLYIGKYLVATREMSHCSIKKGTKYIASGAFSGNNMLRSVTIPNSVTSIGESAFDGCETLTKLNYNGMQTQWKQIEKDGDWMVGSSIEHIHCQDVMIVMTEEIVQQTVLEALPHEEDLIQELEERNIPFVAPLPPPPPAPVEDVECLKVVDDDVETEVIEIEEEEIEIELTQAPPEVEEEEEEWENEIFYIVEKMPEFPGGQQAMMKFLAENVQYPANAMEKGIQGRVICQFVVEKDGKPSNIQVVRTSGDASLDKEAVRVIGTMPKWKPGTQRGKPVRVTFTIPVSFRLQ